MVVINGKALIVSITICVLLAVSGFYLMNYYSRWSDLAADWQDPTTETTAPPPGLMPTEPPGPAETSKDFFAAHRLEREKQRSQRIDLLREVINNPQTSDQVRQQAQEEWLTLTILMEQEMIVEKLVISKGFADVILIFNGDVAHLIVKTDELVPADAIQLTELVSSTLQLDIEKVRVVERK